MEAKANEQPKVLIIGAGSAGLLIAHVLKKKGIQFKIFEKDDSFTQRPRDWNFGIYWAQSRLAECLPDDVYDRLSSVQCDPAFVTSAENFLPTFNGATGELLQKLPTPWNFRVQRRAFIMLLAEGMDIQFGKKLSSINPSREFVTATFTDGSQARGNLLIGADGSRSFVRQYLLGAEEAALLPSPVVLSAVLTTLSTEAAEKLAAFHPIHGMTFHPQGMYTFHALHNRRSPNPAEWEWMIIQTWLEENDYWNLDINFASTSSEILAAMKERGRRLAYPFDEVWASIPENTPAYHSPLSSWPTKSWNADGMLTLAGDAAHPMTFHRGQGLNNAITDAQEFSRKLETMKEQTAREMMRAIIEYEKEMWPRGHKAVIESSENSEMVHNWTRLMESYTFSKGFAKS